MSEANYLPKFEGTSTSIIYILNYFHMDSGFSNRQAIAQANGIRNYTGRVVENMRMVELFKEGRLIKP